MDDSEPIKPMAGCGAGWSRVALLQSTKLLQSVRRGDVSRLTTVLRRGVPQLVNLLHPIYDNSALIVAASEGSLSVLDVLLSAAGADPDLRDSEGRTAVMHAASRAHVDCVTRLIQCGASVNIEDCYACGTDGYLLAGIVNTSAGCTVAGWMPAIVLSGVTTNSGPLQRLQNVVIAPPLPPPSDRTLRKSKFGPIER